MGNNAETAGAGEDGNGQNRCRGGFSLYLSSTNLVSKIFAQQVFAAFLRQSM